MIYLTVFLLAIMSQSAYLDHEPTPPTWPIQFSQTFQQNLYINNTVKYSFGTHWYNFQKDLYRIDRVNSSTNSICSSLQSSGSIGKTCTHLFRQGKKYIIFPDSKVCCMCCTAQQGCGMIPPNWLQKGSYLGTAYFSQHVFNKWGLTMNNENKILYLQEENKSYPYSMRNETVFNSRDDSFEHIYQEWKQGEINDRIFELPKYCSQKCPYESKCQSYVSSSKNKISKVQQK